MSTAKIDMAAIQEGVHRRLECPRHLFTDEKDRQFGRKHTCVRCGWTAYLHEIGNYIQGYRAAGGDPNDVMPGWSDKP